MSYNRGGSMNRDGGRRDYGSGMRRGGGGGNYRSNFGNYNSSMNPWEGGMIPGRGTGSVGQGDLLSQLASPEAQLAIASNLINKLITQQTGPSLLNLGNMSSSGGHLSSYNDGYGNSRNFPDRRRGRMENRRPEPYNKSAMNRRMGPDRRNLGHNRTGSDRKTSFTKSPKTQKDDKDKKDKDAEKANGDVKTESTNDSIRDEKVKKEEDEEDQQKEEEKAEPIPVALLYCHVCCKNMWDEISFTKHMKGRPHQLMMDGINEKYKMKVDLLRHEMRLNEQQREMELERKHRQGMKMYNHPREYCAMCDLHFYGNLISHRKNVRHQKLKAFLHPKCSHCDKEFPTRLEWDDHRLTFDHLYKVADFRRKTKPHLKDDEFDIDELVCPDSVNCGEMVGKEIPVLVRHNSEEDISIENREDLPKEIKKEANDEEDKEGKGDDTKEEIKEPEGLQGIDVDPSKLPKYSTSVIIGKDLLKPVSGYVCQVCNRFLQGEDEAQVHCRSLSHHTSFCNIVRAKARISGRKKRSHSKSKDEKGNDDDAEDGEKNEEGKTQDKGDNNVDDEGNWKRRKNAELDGEVKMDVDDEVKHEKEDVKYEPEDVDSEEENKDGNLENEENKEEVAEENTEENVEEEQEVASSPCKRPQRATRGRRGGKRGK